MANKQHQIIQRIFSCNIQDIQTAMEEEMKVPVIHLNMSEV